MFCQRLPRRALSQRVTCVDAHGTNAPLALANPRVTIRHNNASRRSMTPNQTGTLAPPRSRATRRQFPDSLVPALAPERPERIGVVHLAWEYLPLARTGGLGEAVSGLARFQAASGMSTTVVMPLHRSVREVAKRLDPVGPSFPVQVGPRVEGARLFRLAEPGPGPRIYLIENQDYFDRPGIYGEELDYPDNPRRFALFARAALAVLPRI